MPLMSVEIIDTLLLFYMKFNFSHFSHMFPFAKVGQHMGSITDIQGGPEKTERGTSHNMWM